MNKGKKLSLDYARWIAALMIVAIHTYPLESINKEVDYLCTRVLFRIAVPLFLMITGYFVLPKAINKKNYLMQYTKKILKIYLLSILIYIPVNIYMGYFKNPNLLSLLKDIFLNGTFYHLWYFPALVLGLWITYFLLKIKKNYIPQILTIFLYLIGLFGDSYYGMMESFPWIRSCYDLIFQTFDYTRNGIFYAPIFLMIGYIVSNRKRKEIKRNSFYFLGFWIMMGIEGMVLYHFSIPKHTSMYLFLIPAAYFLFSWMMSNNEKRENIKIRNWATWLYILHPFSIVVLRLIAKITKLESWLIQPHLINYILVILITLSTIYIFEKGMEKIYHDKKNT